VAHYPINQRILEVIVLANSLMEKHKVEHFKFDFMQDSSSFGLCTIDTIKLNYHHAINDSMEEIKDTILHEIAHAIAGNENGHNEYWKSIAKEIGVKIE